MTAIEPFPVRRITALSAATLCAYLSIASHYHQIAEQDVFGFGWGAPPPPIEAFLNAFLATPGVLAGLPIIIAGGLAQSDWVTGSGCVLGAAFFWYCVGWYVDCARMIPNGEQPPKVVTLYVKALGIASAIIFPLGILAGFRIGNHFCAVGAPPYLSQVGGYGIVMFWVTLGAFFAWRRLRARWEHKHPAVQFKIWP